MKFCPKCESDVDNSAKHCPKCGHNVTKEPILKAIHEFGNPGAAIMQRVHRKHRWLNVKVTVTVSVLVQLLFASTLGFVHDWTLVVHALAAVAIVIVMHKFRTGHITTIVCAGLTTFLVFYWTGHLGIQAFLAMWILTFWYAFLGYQIQMNNEMHGGNISV